MAKQLKTARHSIAPSGAAGSSGGPCAWQVEGTAGQRIVGELADRYREAGVPVVIGGLHATLLPDEAKQHADAVCVGEGESQWPQILEDAKHGMLKPFYREEKPGSYDLSRTPIPRYEMLDIHRYNRLTVQTSRGCPLDCEFCAASKIYGRYRIKPAEQVMREIDAIEAVWRNPFIELADDNTFVNKDWAKRFLREMAEREIRWFTETDVSVADDPELLELLAKSGCQQILIGFESIFSQSMEQLDRTNWKRKRMDDYKRSIDAIQFRGITVNGCFILGLDGDTPDCFERIRDVILDSRNRSAIPKVCAGPSHAKSRAYRADLPITSASSAS